MSLIECKNINRYFGTGENRVHVLKDINLSIEKGDFVAIIGQSGSGKSTLMNILGLLDTPTSGTYSIAGTETSKMSADELAAMRRKRFGFIFQRYNLLSSLTARDNVALPSVYAGLDYAKRLRVFGVQRFGDFALGDNEFFGGIGLMLKGSLKGVLQLADEGGAVVGDRGCRVKFSMLVGCGIRQPENCFGVFRLPLRYSFAWNTRKPRCSAAAWSAC